MIRVPYDWSPIWAQYGLGICLWRSSCRSVRVLSIVVLIAVYYQRKLFPGPFQASVNQGVGIYQLKREIKAISDVTHIVHAVQGREVRCLTESRGYAAYDLSRSLYRSLSRFLPRLLARSHHTTTVTYRLPCLGPALYVCMYVCVYECIYIYIVCACVRARACLCECVCVCVRVCFHTHTHTHTNL
jgi:hypothetical protein